MPSKSRDEACSELLSLAVHELRTPANVVGGYLRMLQRDTDGSLGTQPRKMVDEAARSCQRLVELIAELDEVQKLDADLIQLAQQPFDLFPMIVDVANDVQQGHERVRLELRGRASGASIRGDVQRLGRAFSAILRAVLRELAENATVVAERRIEQHQGATSAVVVIADERIVEATYEALPAPFDERRGGLGLALPLARRVIEHHGGRVWSPAGEMGRAAAVVSLPVRD